MGPYRYGAKSRMQLDTADARLIDVFEAAIRVVDIKILEGARSKLDQDRAVAEYRSHVRWPHSKHNIHQNKERAKSHAVDFAPWPIDWNDLERFKNIAYLLRGIALGKGFDLRLGCDWNSNMNTRDTTFMDAGHVELVANIERDKRDG